MKISLNTLTFVNKRYNSAGNPASNGVDDLVTKIGAQLGAVEEVIPFGERYEPVIVAKVVSCVDHENSDHLHVCKLDDDGVAQDVERDENGYVQVVCGAPNVREGLLVAWLPPGSTVPETADSEDPFVLGARPLRGVVSNGMLASARELGIGEDHDGILEINGDIKPGVSFADAVNLRNEVIIDIENKMFTHRPDCFGLLGVAREIEGIHHRPYKSPDWYRLNPDFPSVETDELPLEVRNELPALVPRFMAVAMRDVTIAPSPLWLQIFLTEMGIRPINNIVDYTNFFMLETGQPLHAYDYDKVAAQDHGTDHATLVIRHPKDQEKISLLNGKEITPRKEAIMIATADKLIGVGGVMGGTDTEVDGHTKNIILECATFDMYSIRRTSMTHGLFTDAVTRNNKGQSPLQNAAVLAKIIDEIRQFTGGKMASSVIDDNHLDETTLVRGSLSAPVKVSAAFINQRLGLSLTTQEMMMLLTNVELTVTVEGDDLTITAPFWRTDIEIAEDIVEEVGRLYGFDKLPLELPKRPLNATAQDALLTFKASVRDILSRAGANELLTYSFVHNNLLKKAGQDPELAFQLSNALSPELQYYRMSLLPSLLDKVHANSKAGYGKFALFEMNKTHNLLHPDNDNGLPTEFNMLAFVFAANDKSVDKGTGAAYYQARHYLEYLTGKLGIAIQFEPLQDEPKFPVVKPFDMSRSALVRVKGTDIYLGMIGEFKASVRKQFKLPEYCAGFEIGLNELMGTAGRVGGYVPMSRYPKTEQDICLRVDSDIPYSGLLELVASKLAEVELEHSTVDIRPIDIYKRQKNDEYKQVTFRITVTSYEKTLRDEEVNKMIAYAAKAARDAYGAELV